MKKILMIIIILLFLLIDWLLFHDILKPGEQYTVVEYLTGMVSVPTIIVLGLDLVHREKNVTEAKEVKAK